VSIDVLGYLVEKLSGSSFGEFLRTRLFEPLGMNDTAFWVPSDKTERFTSCYQPEGKGRALRTTPGRASTPSRRSWNRAVAAWFRQRTIICASAS
jgi:CubicO group peptidase (beta-lactamase class C family)